MGIFAGRTLSASNQPEQNGQLRLPKVAGQELCSHVKHFLGYHMIKEFEVLDFLEESGDQPSQIVYCEPADLW